MSRRRAGFDDGQSRGRAAAAEQLMNKLLGETTASRDWSQPLERPAQQDRSVEELVADRGGVSALARELGVARSTVQRWQKGSAPNTSSREKLDRTNEQITKRERRDAAQREWGEYAQRHGGARGIATAAGVSTSTAQKWLSGTSSPSVASQAALKRADNVWRISQSHNLTIDSDTGKPEQSVFFRAAGETQIVPGRKGSPPDARGRRGWGAGEGDPKGQPGIEYTETTAGSFSTFWDSASNGDATSTLDAFQAFLSNEVTGCAEYDPNAGVGVFFDNIDEFDLIEEPHPHLF